eukprot:gnl/MRDRNA2_/MRDRNA2_71837_c0_seq1.p1 gnl/MRDRNA2_/MRDRNA2_71837_c0~~gnl/MRDRNA2_/MRDRNA2_71837_c0_seq1.p1  ORF type:complete len:438 (+),score=80.12 gnl/MRDRNA2_/MRDRNA2_71837_c0_seq1:87-1400(+)
MGKEANVEAHAVVSSWQVARVPTSSRGRSPWGIFDIRRVRRDGEPVLLYTLTPSLLSVALPNPCEESATQELEIRASPAEEALAKYVVCHREVYSASQSWSRVLELGAGHFGLAGLAAAAGGASYVELTDGSDPAVAGLRKVVMLNGQRLDCKVRARKLCWFDVQESMEPFDLILGADIMYRPSGHAPLLALIAKLLTRTEPTAAALLAASHHNHALDAFLDAVKQSKDLVVNLEEMDECFNPPPDGPTRQQPVKLLTIRLKAASRVPRRRNPPIATVAPEDKEEVQIEDLTTGGEASASKLSVTSRTGGSNTEARMNISPADTAHGLQPLVRRSNAWISPRTIKGAGRIGNMISPRRPVREVCQLGSSSLSGFVQGQVDWIKEAEDRRAKDLRKVTAWSCSPRNTFVDMLTAWQSSVRDKAAVKAANQQKVHAYTR